MRIDTLASKRGSKPAISLKVARCSWFRVCGRGPLPAAIVGLRERGTKEAKTEAGHWRCRGGTVGRESVVSGQW